MRTLLCKSYICFLLPLLSYSSLSAQDTPTLKIKKPAPPPLPQAPDYRFFITVYGSSTTTFTTKHVAWETGIRGEYWWLPNGHGAGTGIEYSKLVRGYELSAWNKYLLLPATGYKRSETTLEYFKFPLMILNRVRIRKGSHPFDFGLVPAVLHSVKNEHGRLEKKDIKPFNIAARLSLGYFFYNNAAALRITYTADLLQNLEDRSVYDSSGSKLRDQRSKNHLIGLGIYISIGVK
jgi:hypothetical protein